MPQEHTNTPPVANSAFLRELSAGAARGSSLWVTSFIGSPDLTEVSSWRGKPYNPAVMSAQVDGWGQENAYFSVAALRPTADGELRRRKANFGRLLALVVDDVQLEDITGQVSYVLMTSPGKIQVGILIDHDDEDAANAPLVDRLVTTMVERGMLRADSSGNNSVRYVRLPVGQNQKPRESGVWQHTLTKWSPDVRMSLADAAAAFGVDLDEARSTIPTASTGAFGHQDERVRSYTASVVRGENLHDSLNGLAASMVATSMPGGAVVNVLRGLMDASFALKDERFLARYADIPRAVTSAQQKFTPAAVEQPPKPTALPLVFAEDVTEADAAMPQLVEDVLTQGGLSVMYGESNSGKSFLVCDMCCAIGTGGEWLGKRTVKGAVVYVAGEGSQSIKLRMLAWRQRHNKSPAVAIIPAAVDLLDYDADVQKIVDACQTVEQRYRMPVSLIVIDTLARAFGGGNENASEDMGAVIAHADRLREMSNAAVLFVHHSGKDQAKGSRGHSSLKAATDTEIEVEGEEETHLHTATFRKQRDLGSRGQSVTGKFVVVRMGTDQWGKPLTTCVVEPTEDKPAPKSNKQRSIALHQAFITTLATAKNRSLKRSELVASLKTQGFSSTPIYNIIDLMSAQNVITVAAHMIHLNGAGPDDEDNK
jgi:hypothetical protein